MAVRTQEAYHTSGRIWSAIADGPEPGRLAGRRSQRTSPRGDPGTFGPVLGKRGNHPLRISKITPANVSKREDRKFVGLCREDLFGKVRRRDSRINWG